MPGRSQPLSPLPILSAPAGMHYMHESCAAKLAEERAAQGMPMTCLECTEAVEFVLPIPGQAFSVD